MKQFHNELSVHVSNMLTLASGYTFNYIICSQSCMIMNRLGPVMEIMRVFSEVFYVG